MKRSLQVTQANTTTTHERTIFPTKKNVREEMYLVSAHHSAKQLPSAVWVPCMITSRAVAAVRPPRKSRCSMVPLRSWPRGRTTSSYFAESKASYLIRDIWVELIFFLPLFLLQHAFLSACWVQSVDSMFLLTDSGHYVTALLIHNECFIETSIWCLLNINMCKETSVNLANPF